MKHLLLLIILSACNHEMPAKKNLADTDGDQIRDEYESSESQRYIADVTPLGKIKMELTFQQGRQAIESPAIQLENFNSLDEYILKLMVKNVKTLPMNDYFFEFSEMKVTSGEYPKEINQERVGIRLKLIETDQTVQVGYFEEGNHKSMGDIHKVRDFILPKSEVDNLISGKAYLTISSNIKKPFYEMTQHQTIKEKTYRVYFRDEEGTKVYYVANELNFKDFLKVLNINEYQMIDEVSLLTTTYDLQESSWWVRNLNATDKVVVKENLKNLSDEYLLGFEQDKIKMVRKNGVTNRTLDFSKDMNARALLKIRSLKTINEFSTRTAKEYYINGRRSEGEMCTSVNHYRSIKDVFETTYSEDDFKNDFQLIADNNLVNNFELKPSEDEKGFFWELTVPEGISNFKLILNNLPESDYLRLGNFKSSCFSFQNGPKPGKVLVTPEAELSLEIETYLEKI